MPPRFVLPNVTRREIPAPLATLAKSPSFNSFVCLRICWLGLAFAVVGLGSGATGACTAFRVWTSRLIMMMPSSAWTLEPNAHPIRRRQVKPLLKVLKVPTVAIPSFCGLALVSDVKERANAVPFFEFCFNSTG
ncbi:hypothetical protein D3C84_821900 [compost metagenome]